MLHCLQNGTNETTSSLPLDSNNMACCVMNSHTVVLEYGADECYWSPVFILKHNLVCTLICQVVVCWSSFTHKEEFVWGWFTWDHIISHSETPISHCWKGNRICRKSPLSACNFSHRCAVHAKTAKWYHSKKWIKKSSLMSYYCWKSNPERVRGGWVRDCYDTVVSSDCCKRISFFPDIFFLLLTVSYLC